MMIIFIREFSSYWMIDDWLDACLTSTFKDILATLNAQSRTLKIEIEMEMEMEHGVMESEAEFGWIRC